MTPRQKLQGEYNAIVNELRLLVELLSGADPQKTLQAQAAAWANRITMLEMRQSELRVELAQLPAAPPAKVLTGSWEDGGR